MASSQPATQDESELEGIDAFALGTLTALQMLRYLRYCLRCLATARACGMEPAVAEDWFHHAEQCRRIALALAYVNNSLSRQPDQPELIHRSLAISVRLQEAEKDLDRAWDAIHEHVLPTAIREAIEGQCIEARRLREGLLQPPDRDDPQAMEALWELVEHSEAWKRIPWDERLRYVRGSVYKKPYGKLNQLRAEHGYRDPQGECVLGHQDLDRQQRPRKERAPHVREELDERLRDPNAVEDERDLLLAQDEEVEALIESVPCGRSNRELDREIMLLVAAGHSPAEACRAAGAPQSAWQAIQKRARRNVKAS